MQPTPAHDAYNPDLFALIPPGCARVVEVGCSVGALAKAYLAVHPRCDYRGVEVDPDYAEAARRQGANVYCGASRRCPTPISRKSAPPIAWFSATFSNICAILGPCSAVCARR